MSTRIILDTGPLVACLLQRDQHHRWATSQFHEFDSPLLTCEAVMSEAFHLVGRNSNARRTINGWLNQNLVQVDFSFAAHRAAVSRMMDKYADLPMDFADACLVRMAEIHQGARVFTLDQHFRVYRMGRRKVPLIIPPAEQFYRN